ncbi:dihydrofolate reductase [Parendozoicomonas haliclonae]|uniref:Dihydrofolate reductase n=1 Tax=Parendozoicomonas haliclonae TaxID=1960125 RepID=A0A1X7AG34_9GAMM|nr:dihydrofolate reductase [Parendozoicomonas haliclonae]SMA39187.1 Dihydrofolate reductase type 3 [Parendozoicomonas haliclonae]
MKVAMIAAVAENNAIGIDNKLPWYLPGDLRYFKAVTMGKPIIMGRKTFESLRKPLPGRTNIVLTRDPEWNHEGVRVVANLDEALALAESIATINGISEVMVIGGEQIYRQALPKADRLYLTKVGQAFEGDAFFPEIVESEWTEFAREDNESEDGLKYSYLVLDRVSLS